MHACRLQANGQRAQEAGKVMRSGAELENLRAHGPSMVPTDTKDQPAPQPACLPEPPSSASPPPSHSAAMSLDPPPEELVGFLDHPQHASSTLRVSGLHAASISEARLQHALRESVPPKTEGTFADSPFSPPRIVEISPPSIAFSDVTPAAAAWLSAQESSFDNARLSSPAGTLHSHL